MSCSGRCPFRLGMARAALSSSPILDPVHVRNDKKHRYYAVTTRETVDRPERQSIVKQRTGTNNTSRRKRRQLTEGIDPPWTRGVLNRSKRAPRAKGRGGLSLASTRVHRTRRLSNEKLGRTEASHTWSRVSGRGRHASLCGHTWDEIPYIWPRRSSTTSNAPSVSRGQYTRTSFASMRIPTGRTLVEVSRSWPTARRTTSTTDPVTDPRGRRSSRWCTRHRSAKRSPSPLSVPRPAGCSDDISLVACSAHSQSYREPRCLPPGRRGRLLNLWVSTREPPCQTFSCSVVADPSDRRRFPPRRLLGLQGDFESAPARRIRRARRVRTWERERGELL